MLSTISSTITIIVETKYSDSGVIKNIKSNNAIAITKIQTKIFLAITYHI